MKLAVVWPELTVTLAGTVRLALLLLSATANPAAGAACVSVTVQDVLPGVLIVAFVQLNPLSWVEAVRARMLALLTPA